MRTELRPRPHDVDGRAGIVIDLWYDGAYIGCLYGADGPGIRLISKHPAFRWGTLSDMATEILLDLAHLHEEYKILQPREP